jgi:hypothetical protein
VSGELSVRPTARVILLDEDDRLFLLRIHDPAAARGLNPIPSDFWLKQAYVGQSGKLKVRLRYWERHRPHLGHRIVLRNGKQGTRLGVEQIAIEWFREFVKKNPDWTLLNKINAISPGNPGYKDAIKAGKAAIKKSLENPSGDEFDDPGGENFDLPGAFYSDLGGCAISQWHGLMCTF